MRGLESFGKIVHLLVIGQLYQETQRILGQHYQGYLSNVESADQIEAEFEICVEFDGDEPECEHQGARGEVFDE